MNYYSDKYWHIQMHAPDYPNLSPNVDSEEMLSLQQPVIGIGEWNGRRY